MTAASQAAARTAIGAGTSSLALGTTASTAKAGNYQPTWAQVTGKPTTFTPATHSHAWGEVTGKPTTFAPASHTHTVAQVTGLQGALDGKAATSHSHSWAQVTGKPSTFPPATHSHDEFARVAAAPATWLWEGTALPTAASQVHAQARVGDFIVAPNLTADPGWHRITGV